MKLTLVELLDIQDHLSLVLDYKGFQIINPNLFRTRVPPPLLDFATLNMPKRK